MFVTFLRDKHSDLFYYLRTL